ncbi:type II secretion system protein [Desulforamulus ruminis]|uniref:Prepilin-type N-terminal cleavage/methylation domain-containing protein n=1 Tax=Desulforamulus ruminis (strain ATCC 23193 / DSM 2154 / NCIMB 8452 / DL) TaxID=696281 RepID=F6DRJ1_DESRL|nr:prepilin-type N-terminal cleavage/methylation domain-containing protein [Desulforamulus ruminis]AEG58745.1 hypothetical protein Desru_0459 [Desulforamulus ruminis DSM 2154]
MVKNVKSRIKGLLKSQSGFTLIELIIVVGIMGFLVAMIAPRLAGVMSGAVDQVCDSNQTRLQQVLGTYTEKNNNIPAGLTNLVIEESAGNYVAMNAAGMVDDNDKSNGAEVFSSEFIGGVKATLHTLNAAEAEELRGMGITSLFNLNVSKAVTEYNGNEMSWNENIPDSTVGFMAPAEIEEGLTVMMYGGGSTDTAANASALSGELRQPDLAYRIILGVGPESNLVKEGLITKAGMCPGGLQRSDHFAYNNYNIALPRLAETVKRLPATEVEFEDGLTGRTTTFEFEAQEPYQATTLCPEGHTIAGTAGEWTVAP